MSKPLIKIEICAKKFDGEIPPGLKKGPSVFTKN